MDAKGLADYVLTDSRYDERVINFALNNYGLSFVRHVFFGLKSGKLKQPSTHPYKVIGDILDFYKDNEKNFSRIDNVLVKLERRIPQFSVEELIDRQEEGVKIGLRIEKHHLKRRLQRMGLSDLVEELKN